MALDKQRILNELGNVMNQLQSADCGCMGKLFSNQGQGQGVGAGQAMMGNPLPTCGGCRRGSCAGHGGQSGVPNSGYGGVPHSGYGGVPCGGNGSRPNYGTPYAGEPYSMQSQCMGHCNPPKLYADTYNYLNQNLMQPTIQEVYSDLKSITPTNTMANNPMAAQMGLSSTANTNSMGQNQLAGSAMGNQNPMQNMGNAIGRQNVGDHNPLQNMGNPNTMQMHNSSSPGNTMNTMQNQQAMGNMNMSGMGPQILGMLQSEGGSKSMQGQGRPLSGPMVVDAPQSPHGQVGITPLASVGGGNQGQNNPNMGLPNRGQMQNTEQNVYAASMPGNQVGGNMTQSMTGNQQMAQINPGQQMTPRAPRSYGQYTPGMAKFNEMFPGVMQGLGGDLDFDPMAIAIQMNPANQQKAAMQTMQKVMGDNKGFERIIDPTSNAARMQPAIAGANAAAANLNQPMHGQPNEQMAPQNLSSGQLDPIQAQMANGQAPPQQPGQALQQQSQINPQSGNAERLPQTGQLSAGGQVPQQVYTALTGAPQMTRQQIQNQDQYQTQPPQQMIDPNTGAVIRSPNFPETYEGAINPNSPVQQQPLQAYTTALSDAPQEMIKEPIFPVDNSRNQTAPISKQQKYYQYNTLGQPIEMLPAHLYYSPDPGLPQTLSPQGTPAKMRTDQRYSNVKATVSKTSIMGGTGRTPSKSQLQHIYNQYKGSQSFTQQNMKQPNQGGSYSDGKLNVPQRNEVQMRHVPVEKMGGDTAANNQAMYNQQIPNKVENVVGHLGDAPAANKPEEEAMPAKKYRNGLQDMVYTTYPTSAAWSFHGNPREPFSTRYRYK